MSGNELIGVHLNQYKPTFAQNPLHFYYLHFESNRMSFDLIHIERNHVYYESQHTLWNTRVGIKSDRI